MQIKAGIETRLALILTASSYYTNAGSNVLARPADINDIDSARLPAVYVFTGTEDQPGISQGAKCYTTKTEFLVRGFVQSANPDDDIIKLKADIKRAVLGDLTLGGTALLVEYLGGYPVQGLHEHLQRAEIFVAFDVLFQWEPTAP